MIQSNYTVRIIEPSEGFTLTQSADVDLENRTLSKKVFLAVNDDPSNWKEITDTEADEKNEGKSVSECVSWAKAQGLDVAKVLAEHFTVEEIAI